MKGSIGCPARIIARVPQAGKPAALRSAGLSEKAKRRPGVSGRYFRKSARHPANGKKNAVLACRHFGTRRPRFYHRKARYDKARPIPPGPGSTAPKRKSDIGYNCALVAEVHGIRKDNPTYSGKNIRPILLRSMAATCPRYQPWDGS